MSQRRISRWIAMSASMAVVLWSAGQARAQIHLNVNVSPTHGGSIHFGIGGGGHRPVAPIVAPGSVRYEHYEHHEPLRVEPHWGGPPALAYRHPYRDDYFRRFRPGWRTVMVGPTEYSYYPSLPTSYETVGFNGMTYYRADGIYYVPYINNGQTVYMVVPPPGP